MGRLTLNVLLSFAQFEREVISERVRDKIAASKAKGMWMGGCVALGYYVRERKLIVDEAEATVVRHIFQRYVELGTVRSLLEDLRASGVVTKRQIMRDGRVRGGVAFSRGALYHFLKNRIYRGDIVHHDKVYSGEHEAIVSQALFEQVQEQLASNIGDRRSGRHFVSPSLLAGMIRDQASRPMSPSHTLKSGKRYRYYVSNEAGSEQGGVAMRLPAKTLEAAVIAALLLATGNTPTLIDGVSSISATEISRLQCGQKKFAEQIQGSRTSAIRPLLLTLDLRIVVEGDRILASCCKPSVIKALDLNAAWSASAARVTFEVPASLQRRGQEHRLRVDRIGEGGERDHKLIALIIRAYSARKRLAAMDKSAPRDTRRELARVARVCYLAPDIIAAIYEGRQPRDLRSRKLERGELPFCWQAQREMLGFG